MKRMTHREFLKKRAILQLLQEQGYPTYAKLFDLFALHLTNDPDVVAYMDPEHGEIVINDDLDQESVSTVVRHEILHEYFTHYARELVWQQNHSDKRLNHRTANIAGDYDISNKGYTDRDKYIVRTLTINNKLMRGLVTEDDRPDLVDKSFEEMIDILNDDDKKIEQEMQQQIQQNQDESDSGDNSQQSDKQSDSKQQGNNSANGSSGDSDSNDDDNTHAAGQIGYRGSKESREKEAAARQAQIDKETNDGINSGDDSINQDADADNIQSEIKKAFDDLSNNQNQTSPLIREVNTNKRKEIETKRADDLAKYRNKPINKFELSFTNFLKYAMGLSRGKTWSKVNKTYADSGLLRKGLAHRRPSKVPSVNVYFDRSGSWNSDKTRQGYEIISKFNEYVRQGRVQINLYYFSENVHSKEISAINEGCTNGQPIIEHINVTKPDNVIIMTDDDIDDCESSAIVPGAVWLLFVSNSGKARSENLIDHIKGQMLTEIYDINLKDY